MPATDNQILAALPRSDRLRLIAAGEPVLVRLSQVLGEAGETTRYVYFPTDSFISVITTIDHHPGLEVGMIGREGMLGSHLALGLAREPLKSVVQGAGTAWRVAAKPFLAELAHSSALRLAMGRYVYVLMAQRAAASGCLRYHEIGPRLARWLLMSQDRARSARFKVTQVFMAYMLGVRRVGVTNAASMLQRRGLIAYHRGEMNVIDRAGLEQAACSCYATDCNIEMQVMR